MSFENVIYRYFGFRFYSYYFVDVLLFVPISEWGGVEDEWLDGWMVGWMDGWMDG
jgi:hypothetical protein